ncbi:MAG: tetratricopeptide repeat protein [Candidatus Heimdallarchaeota archaeon]|nr:tetratricopeptide repeat protein [Candidatus Heimdallarchaeota archaeon]
MNSEIIKKIDHQMLKGEYKSAFDLINETQSKTTLSEEEQIILDSKKCLLLRYLGEFEELIKISKKVQSKAKTLNENLIQVDALILEIFAHYRLNKVEYVLELINKAENLLSKLKTKDVVNLRTRLLSYKAYACITNGDFDQAQLHSRENFMLCKEQNNPELLAAAHYINGWTHMHKGDMRSAAESYKESLIIREELNNNPYDLSHSLFGLGFVYRNLGDLDDAFSCLNRCKKIRVKIGNQQDIIWTLLNLGDVLYTKNEVKKAQEYYDEALLISQSLNYISGIIFSLRRLSSVYENLEEPQLVLDTLEKSLDYSKQLEDVDPEVYSLFDLIRYLLENNIESKELKEYTLRLKTINQTYKNKIFNLVYRLSQALLLNAKKEKRNQIKARNLFRDISEEEIISFEYTKIAMQNYSKLLAEELTRYLNDEILTSQLTDLSESISHDVFHRSYTQVAENFLDLSQIALQEIDINKARELLRRAQYLCDFLNLYNKGSTPFRIIYSLFAKERSLSELSKILKITKGALSTQLKSLIDLEIVRISREEQVRSATMLKKYYTLGDMGIELLRPLSIKLCDSLNVEVNDTNILIDNLMKPRLLLKIIRDTTNLIDNFQNFLEEQVFLKSSDSKKKERDVVLLNDVKKIFGKTTDVQVDQFFLTEKQYQTYKKMWKEFSEKIRSEVVVEDITSPEYHSKEKPIYVANLVLPINEMMALERYQLKQRKIKEKKPDD